MKVIVTLPCRQPLRDLIRLIGPFYPYRMHHAARVDVLVIDVEPR